MATEEDKLSEKKLGEKLAAERFLAVYNRKMMSSFKIVKLGDTPDVECEDGTTGRKLFLEISHLEDREGDIEFWKKYLKDKSEWEGPSPATRDSWIEIIGTLEKKLQKKLLSSYGQHTALVFSQFSIVWEAREWQTVAYRFRNQILKGREGNYGAGVWILCTDNTVYPTGDDIFPIQPPTEQTA